MIAQHPVDSVAAVADPPRFRHSVAGFTYLAVLFLVALLGIALASAGVVWSTYSRRDKETELLFVGEQFQDALRAWNRANATVGDGFPKTLEQLLADPNAPDTRRFLRRIYVDPMTGKPQWGLVRGPAGGIIGVHSLSSDKPIRTQVPESLGGVSDATSYADWKFIAKAGSGDRIAAAPSAASEDTGLPSTPLPAVTDPTVPPVPVAPPPPVDPKERRCKLMIQIDHGACSTLANRYGPLAGVPCATSARAREAACEAGSPIPPLVTNVR
ncbi:MAG: type II secretion system protein [Betaproteobacteria bacterium]